MILFITAPSDKIVVLTFKNGNVLK